MSIKFKYKFYNLNQIIFYTIISSFLLFFFFSSNIYSSSFIQAIFNIKDFIKWSFFFNLFKNLFIILSILMVLFNIYSDKDTTFKNIIFIVITIVLSLKFYENEKVYISNALIPILIFNYCIFFKNCEKKNLLVFFNSLNILAFITILIFFANYSTEFNHNYYSEYVHLFREYNDDLNFFYKLKLFFYSVQPSIIINKTFLFFNIILFLNLFYLDIFKKKSLIICNTIILSIFLFKFANTYNFIIFFFIIFIFIFKKKILSLILKKQLKKNIIVLYFFFLIIFFTIILNINFLKAAKFMIDLPTNYLASVNKIETYNKDCPQYEFFTAKKEEFLKFKLNNCFGNRLYQSFYWSYISYLDRVIMSYAYDKNLNFKDILVGLSYEKYSNLIEEGYFTHNSFKNLFYRYGILYFFLLNFLIYLFLKKNNFENNIIFYLFFILFASSFDDYLYGNSFELTSLIWILFGIFNNKQLIKKK